jgi:hypothetical protein
MITKDFLEEELKSLLQQRENAMITLHQADGAIQLCQHLLEKLDANDNDALRVTETASQ